ncbi:MAG: hypothetical protein GXO30_03465 [Epsilonproteobacteria bacterium]|nr:hypothetical protein [Campylobacterota bacterium]
MPNQEHILKVTTSWITKMFGSTDYLFGLSTTWQYMLFSIVASYSLLMIIYLISKLFRYEFRVLKAIKKLLYYTNYTVISVGILFYGMVLFKKMWVFA